MGTKKYRYIVGCGRMQNKRNVDIDSMLSRAASSGAPSDAIEQREDGSWMVLSDMPKPIQRRILARTDR